MPKQKTSFLWQFFRPSSGDRASCNFCDQNFSYKTTTTNLKKHIQRRHPNMLTIGRHRIINNNDTDIDVDVVKLEHSKEVEELLEGENILIEYCDDSDINQEKRSLIKKDDVLLPKIFRIPISKKLSIEKSQTEKLRKPERDPQLSSLEDSRNELIKVEIEVAKKELEIKRKQLIYAEREDERRQKEHEVTLKIKEAQLQAILKQK